VDNIISADSHVIEPADVWTARIDRRFLDRAPRVVHQDFHGRPSDVFVAEGLPPFPVAGFAVAGVDPKEYRERMTRGYPGVRPSAWDPVERLSDQSRDGVAAEVLYPSLGMSLFGIEDGELRAASFRAYNDWLADYCSHNQQRLVGIAMVSLDDAEAGVAELRRVANKGLRGGMIWAEAPQERPYSDRGYDNFWAAAQDLNLPLSLHILTDRRRKDASMTVMRYYPHLHHAVERSLAEFIFGGVLERYPRLRLVSVENDIGWLAHYLQRSDHSYEKYRWIEPGGAIPNPPSFYFRRQVFATFQDDRVGVLTREFIGADNLMWGSDFPHSDSTWPNSREVIAKDFAGVPANEVRKMVADNAARLYKLD
jgi:predicted TIM-barrel fold metal-dependent hydrolase